MKAEVLSPEERLLEVVVDEIQRLPTLEAIGALRLALKHIPIILETKEPEEEDIQWAKEIISRRSPSPSIEKQ
jgi:hypothetical protein